MKTTLIFLKALGFVLFAYLLLLIICLSTPVLYIRKTFTLVALPIEYFANYNILQIKQIVKYYKLNIKTALILLLFTLVSPLILIYTLISLFIITINKIETSISLFEEKKLKVFAKFLKSKTKLIKKELRTVGKMEV